MPELLRENAQWRKKKSPIIAKYQADHAKLMSVIAGRGFSSLPGYAYSAENDLELLTKSVLAELNYSILEETIMRELKQSGLDYDLAYKNAVLAWEIEKQALMADWDAELQGIKRGMASEEETLDLLAVEVSKRSIVLLESKTALALSMEAYKKTLADLEGDVSPYEVQLANGKLLTAQKKLELLPIIEVILTKEQELLVIEQTKAAAYTALMAAESAVSAKKETLTPVINDLAGKSEEYATLITTDQIPKEELITDEKISQAQAAVTKSGYQVQELTADIETETKHLELMGEKRALQETQFGLEQNLTQHEKELTATYQGDVMADFSETLESERATATQVIDDKTTAEATRNATKLTSTNTLASGEKNADSRLTAYQINGMQQEANAKAAADLTAGLTHLIS
jgi:hypothetical protein